MEMKPQQDTLTIDPIAMNVVNRIASGSRLDGSLRYQGGLLVQGETGGSLHVLGRLIVWRGGVVRGRVRVDGDCYVFGQIGEAGGQPEDTDLECHGTIFVAHTGVSTGTLRARRLQLYEGADLQGPFRTLKFAGTLPVLHTVQPDRPASAPGHRP
ncbi:MAG: polymer-forming cytoskeletal protein [Pseudomonadota bacterium]|nr:hypothetical protein [Betaproteobacteria bacterium]